MAASGPYRANLALDRPTAVKRRDPYLYRGGITRAVARTVAATAFGRMRLTAELSRAAEPNRAPCARPSVRPGDSGSGGPLLRRDDLVEGGK
jgi:hypothetical protein